MKVNLKMVDAEISDLRKQCVSSLYSCAENVGLFLDGQEKKTEFLKLKSCIDEYCMMEARQNVANQALEKAKVCNAFIYIKQLIKHA